MVRYSDLDRITKIGDHYKKLASLKSTNSENLRITQPFSKLGKMIMVSIIVMFIASVANAQTEPNTQQVEQPIIFLDNINSWEEAIKPLQGKKVYVDIWATWCEPCLKEFAHNEALKKNLTENGIQLLYISLDGSNDDKKWRDCIKQYNLTGTHIRFQEGGSGFRRQSEGLGLDLQKLFFTNAKGGISVSIPRYILIDEKGNILDKNAKKPSQIVSGEKLW